MVSLRSFSYSLERFKEFDTENVVLFQIKAFGRKSKETVIAR